MCRIPTEVQVRPGSEADVEAVTAIYNHDVRETALTFDTTAFTPAERPAWLRSHPEDGPFRLLVASYISPSRNAPEVLGHATSSPYRPKAAYSTSVEVSAYAAIAQPDEPSVRLHGAFGFRHADTYTEEVGRKFGRYWDVSWHEKPMLSRTGPSASPVPSRTPR
ncbi:GNAT family N-acetyltransferase [Streptomyces clavifer]|uniref:GNAT family N-acetyltransferase n=1 Tax=Streptomyces clavifer TaxID=68188 RepID=UPI00379FDECB